MAAAESGTVLATGYAAAKAGGARAPNHEWAGLRTDGNGNLLAEASISGKKSVKRPVLDALQVGREYSTREAPTWF